MTIGEIMEQNGIEGDVLTVRFYIRIIKEDEPIKEEVNPKHEEDKNEDLDDLEYRPNVAEFEKDQEAGSYDERANANKGSSNSNPLLRDWGHQMKELANNQEFIDKHDKIDKNEHAVFESCTEMRKSNNFDDDLEESKIQVSQNPKEPKKPDAIKPSLANKWEELSKSLFVAGDKPAEKQVPAIV